MNFSMLVSLVGGLSLFLFGMKLMGDALEKVSGSKIEKMLDNLKDNIWSSVLLGAAVTATIQSSTATTVIVVGLVNTRLLKLHQAIGIIMGANIGTTITAHILRLTDFNSSNVILQLLRPETLTPLVTLAGILLLLGSKKIRYREAGMGMLGFTLLFSGMTTMQTALSPLAELPQFVGLFGGLYSPFMGVLAGAVVTVLIQLSAASVGILQALSSTGIVPFSAAFHFVMGANIGTCITAILASVGASKSAKRAAVVHISFNSIGTVLFLIGSFALGRLFDFPFLYAPASKGAVANFHTLFNVTMTLTLIPFVGWLEKLATLLVPDSSEPRDPGEFADEAIVLDDRFLVVPAIAISYGREIVLRMCELAQKNFDAAVNMLQKYDAKDAELFRRDEDTLDYLEDKLSRYLLKISQTDLSEEESRTVNQLLHLMGEFERIGDYSMNIVEAVERLHLDSAERFSVQAQLELDAISEAVVEIIDMSIYAFESGDTEYAMLIEPLEEIIDLMELALRDRHAERLKQGYCSVDTAFPFVETLSCMERIADHCSNIGIFVLNHERPHDAVDRHDYLSKLHGGGVKHYSDHLERYREKYLNRI